MRSLRLLHPLLICIFQFSLWNKYGSTQKPCHQKWLSFHLAQLPDQHFQIQRQSLLLLETKDHQHWGCQHGNFKSTVTSISIATPLKPLSLFHRSNTNLSYKAFTLQANFGNGTKIEVNEGFFFPQPAAQREGGFYFLYQQKKIETKFQKRESMDHVLHPCESI